jgi:CheY-like chemotaxis protein
VQPNEQAIPGSSEPLSVIVADDMPEIRMLLNCWLSEVGCTVKCVSSGNELIRLACDRHVDVIVTDVLMPDGDGLDAILELKRSHPKARVIAISGGGRHLRGADCLEFAKGIGAHELLLKPFGRDEFMAVFNRVSQQGA